MAYVLGFVLLVMGIWLVIDRKRFSIDNARWHRTLQPFDSSDSKVQRLNSFGFVLFGLMFVGTGVYVIAIAAKVIP